MIKFRILKIYLILRNIFSVQHWRGHGIHSPFMYRFVREVLMQKRALPNVNELPVNLKRYNLLKEDILFLKNLYHYLGYTNCIIVGEGIPAENTLYIAPLNTDLQQLNTLLKNNMYDCCCIAVLGTNKSRVKYDLCQYAVANLDCVSVNLYRSYVFFFDKKLQKQYFRIRNVKF